jgi:ACS family hexuronate transporter-like MFS transporter
VLAPAIVPWIAFAWGWHAVYVAVGALGMIWLCFWIPLFEIPERQKRLRSAELALIRSDADETRKEEKVPWLSLLKYRQAWAVIIARMMTDPVWWFFLIWLPDFFKATRHLNIKSSWSYLVTIYLIVTVLSVGGGWLTGHLIKRGWSVTRARKSCMLFFALCVVPILYVTKVSDWNAVLLIGVAGAAHQAWSANLFTTVSDMFPKSAVGPVIGLSSMAGAVTSMAWPICTGKLLDHFHEAPTTGYAIVFGVCAFSYIGAWAVNHALAPSYKPLKMV